MLKARYFKNKHGELVTTYFYILFLYFLLDNSVCKKLEKFNHNFNNTHTSLKTIFPYYPLTLLIEEICYYGGYVVTVVSVY